MTTTLQTLVKDPLIHFLMIGACFLAFTSLLSPAALEEDGQHIRVDRQDLLNFIQYRAKTFDSEQFEQRFSAMPPEQRRSWLEDYVREEVLYREAKQLQLDKNDQVARQRLVQQMRYLTQSFVSADLKVGDDDLQAFLEEHRERYTEPAKMTFTHVFLSLKNAKQDHVLAQAQQMRSALNQQAVPFHQAMAHGDRFLYHRNYVNKDAEFIASHFGEDFQQAVFALPASETQWAGPFLSPYGYHLVMASQHQEAYTPSLNDIKPQLAQDWLRQRQQATLEQAIEQLVSRYTVDVSTSVLSEPFKEGV